MPEPSRLMLAGDWHGDSMWAEIMIGWAKKHHCDAILQLGDWGYWPRWEEETRSQTGTCHFTQKMKAYAEKVGVRIYWLDGNHENHEALTPGQGNEWCRHLGTDGPDL
jgi:predicted phosphodiesterase